MDDLTLTYAGRDHILAGLFELTTTYVEDAKKRTKCKALAAKLGGDPEAMFFEST